ncbi:MAG: histone deacetylase family protein [Rhodospirillales bacterium]|nr:histone deacetylase family protein [Rhodospirillales bacterium]
MSTLLLMPPQCFDHDTSDGHPECADRLRAIEGALNSQTFSMLMRGSSGPATRAQLERAHEPDYVAHILTLDGCPDFIELDADTVLSSGSVRAARYGAGAACQAIDEVLLGQARNAFCAIRPPGHHAEAAHAMGFCLFNNAAIAALQARHVHGLSKIAVIDFDVHHGNGVQSIFWNDENLFYGSLHEAGGFPQTGLPEETGDGHNIFNVPLASGAGSEQLHCAWHDVMAPQLVAFAPQLIIICAGFDGHRQDFMGSLNYTTADYGWITAEILTAANALCRGRVVSLLEGGYHLPSLAASVAAHVKALLEV